MLDFNETTIIDAKILLNNKFTRVPHNKKEFTRGKCSNKVPRKSNTNNNAVQDIKHDTCDKKRMKNN